MPKIILLAVLSLFLVACAPVEPVAVEETEEVEVVPVEDVFVEENLEISLDLPEEGTKVVSPLEVSGQASGSWFFEGSLPIELRDENDLVIASGRVFAVGDWMTTEMVEFKGSLTFSWDENAAEKPAKLVLMKDNPSGLPENDAEYSVEIKLS